MEYFTREFLIQEIQEYIPFDIHNLFNTSPNVIFNEFKKKYRFIKLNQKFSLKYCNDDIYIKKEQDISCNTGMTFYDYINSQNNVNKRLSINIHKGNMNDIRIKIMNLGDIHTLNLISCSLENVSSLANVHTLNLSKSKSGYNYNVPSVIQTPSGTPFKGVEFLGKVHTLDLSYTGMTDEDIKHLGNCYNLNIGYNDKITDECLKYLGKVHSLNIAGCYKITNEGIKHLVNVSSLNISNCNKITNEGIKHLGKVHSLNILDCNKITINGIKHLANINTLEINGCDIPTCMTTLGNIKSLILHDCRNITNTDLKYLSKCHTLDLSNGANITREGIKHLENVHTLNVSGCKKIMNEDLKYLGNCHTLNLDYCEKITDEGLKYLAKCHTLHLFGCNDITDKGLKYLAKCNTIYIDCSFTKNISEDCIRNLGNVFIQMKEKMNTMILIPGGYTYSDTNTYWKKYNNKDYAKMFLKTTTQYNNTEQYEYLQWEF